MKKTGCAEAVGFKMLALVVAVLLASARVAAGDTSADRRRGADESRLGSGCIEFRVARNPFRCGRRTRRRNQRRSVERAASATTA